MKFEQLAPNWDKKLKKASMFDTMEDLGSFNTCIIGEITTKLELPINKVSKIGNPDEIVRIPKCKGCWELGVSSFKVINGGKPYSTSPSQVKVGIANFYKNVVPKIEQHMRVEHRIE